MKFKDLTKEQLWELRNEICLNSLFISDYRNSFGFDEHDVCSFFDGYMEYLDEIASEETGNPEDGVTIEEVFEQDNIENLHAWFYCFDDLSWIKNEENDAC